MTIENVLDMFYENKNCPAFHDALCMAASAFQKQIISYYCEQEAKPHRRQRVRKLTEEEEKARKKVLEFDEEEESVKAMIEFYENIDELEVFRKYAKEFGLTDEG